MRVKADQQTRTARPRLVFFHSRVSGPARRIDGYIANLLQRRQNHTTFLVQQVVVEDHPALAERFGVGDIPTLFVIERNRVRVRIENPRGRHDLEHALSPWLKPGRRSRASLTAAVLSPATAAVGGG